MMDHPHCTTSGEASIDLQQFKKYTYLTINIKSRGKRMSSVHIEYKCTQNNLLAFYNAFLCFIIPYI